MLSMLMLDLTLGEVLDAVPTDAGAIFAYLLIVGFIILVWRGSRSSGESPAGAPADPTPDASTDASFDAPANVTPGAEAAGSSARKGPELGPNPPARTG